MKRLACLLCLCSFALQAAGASSVVLVASPFPKELLNTYKKAFDDRYPNYRVEFVNFPATNIISHLRDRAPGSRPDVFWGSSPDSFQALRRHGLLENIGSLANPEIPARIGRIDINGPENDYLGQALSGYGIMWNKRYLASRALPPPATWSDLARPEYSGHVVMSSPSRSSTTHLIVESILQGTGWNEGWSLILQIAGNCATITERSFDVPNNITRGRFGLGPVVDFLALSGKYSGFPVDFAYAWPSVTTPASIGLISGSRNPDGGKAFIEFTLSREGQSLLLQPEISRLPVLPGVYETRDRPVDYPDLVDITKSDLPAYSPDISESRYLIVGALFDQIVTFRHQELVAITRLIQSAEKQLRLTPHPEAAKAIARARHLVYRTPVAEDDELLTTKPLRTRAHIAAIAAREAEWMRQAAENHAAARKLLDAAQKTMQTTMQTTLQPGNPP